LHGFSGPLGLNFFGKTNKGRGGAILTPNELVFPFGVLMSVPILVKIDQEMGL